MILLDLPGISDWNTHMSFKPQSGDKYKQECVYSNLSFKFEQTLHTVDLYLDTPTSHTPLMGVVHWETLTCGEKDRCLWYEYSTNSIVGSHMRMSNPNNFKPYVQLVAARFLPYKGYGCTSHGNHLVCCRAEHFSNLLFELAFSVWFNTTGSAMGLLAVSQWLDAVLKVELLPMPEGQLTEVK